MTWKWRYEDAGGAEVTLDQPEDFPNQSDAESWLGEEWKALAEEGVTAVTLFEGDAVIYGPMSLSAE